MNKKSFLLKTIMNSTLQPQERMDTTTSGKQLVLCFWDNVEMNKTLFYRFHKLNKLFIQTIMDLSKDSDIMVGKIEKAKRFDWIINQFSKRSPGPSAKKDLLSVKHTLGRYSALCYMADKNETSVSTQQMEERGLDETVYAETMGKLSSFLAWAYNLVVPKKIRKIYDKHQEVEDVIHIPAFELAQVGEDDLANNISCRSHNIIIIDNSISMGESHCLNTIKRGLTEFVHKFHNSPNLSRCMELYVATCGGEITEITNFTMIEEQIRTFDELVLKPYGQCKMADAINLALNRLQERIDKLSDPYYGIKYYKPRMFILSVGNFKGDMQKAISRIHEQSSDIQVHAIGIGKTAQMDNLKALDPEAVMLNNLDGFFENVLMNRRKTKTSIPGCQHVSRQ